MTNQEKFIQIFGIVAWQAMIVFTGLAEQYKEYWTSPYNEKAEVFDPIKATLIDCRDCKEYDGCPCGKDGHENGTSQGCSIGGCKDFEPQIGDGVKLLWKCERCGKLIPYMADFCHECAYELLGEPPKPFEPPKEESEDINL